MKIHSDRRRLSHVKDLHDFSVFQKMLEKFSIIHHIGVRLHVIRIVYSEHYKKIRKIAVQPQRSKYPEIVIVQFVAISFRSIFI